MLKMVCIPSETNDYWKAKAYIIQMAFHRNKTWDFRVQDNICYLISEKLHKIMSTFLGDKEYLTERHVGYLCVKNA